MEYNDSRDHHDEHKEEKYMKYPSMGCPMAHTCPMYGNPMHCPMFQTQQYSSSMMQGYMRDDAEDELYARPYRPRPFYPRPFYPRPFYPGPFFPGPFFPGPFFPFFW